MQVSLVAQHFTGNTARRFRARAHRLEIECFWARAWDKKKPWFWRAKP